MKTPRPEDYDPNQQPVPQLGSPLDDLPEITPRSKRTVSQKQTAAPTEATVTQNEISQYVRTSVRPYVRTLTRMPFEIYRDQHATLKQFSLEEQTQGEKGSMSQMVREALDAYILKRRNGQR